MRQSTDLVHDPILLEILWGRLVTVMDEVDAATVRTAFSTVLAEGRDFACILLDDRGRSIAQGTFSTTAFVVTLPRTAKRLLEVFPAIELAPGDMLATNDPWLGSGHLPDFSFISPIHYHGRLIGYVGTVAHLTDAGGRLGYFNGQDVYEEGIRLPPCRLFAAGQPNRTAFDILGANVRASRLVLGDMEAIAATHQLGVSRISQLLDEYRLSDLRSLADEILGRSAGAMRAAIGQIPCGEYQGEMLCDGYGDPVTLRVRIDVEPETLGVDFAGSSPQTRRAAINAVWNLTYADTMFALKCALIPETRNNEGHPINNTPDLQALWVRSLRTPYLRFFPDSPKGSGKPFADVRVRQAFNYGINVEAIMQSLLGGRGLHTATLMTPDFPGFDPSIAPYPYDPEKAKQLLADAGYASGFTFDFETWSAGPAPKPLDIAQIVASDLAKIGVTAHVVPVDLSTSLNNQNKKTIAPFQLWSWGAGRVVCWDKFWGPFHPQSSAGFLTDEQVTAWIDEINRTTDGAARDQLCKQLQQRVHDLALVVPLFAQPDIYAKRSNVEWTPRADELILPWEVTPKR